MQDQEGNYIFKLPPLRHGQVRTPQFMGWQEDKSIEQIRNFIKKQKRARGFTTEIVSGNIPTKIDLPATARIFLGFALDYEDTDSANLPTGIELTINNEILIQGVFPRFFMSEFTDEEYYYFPRPLSGTDVITMKSQASQNNIQHAIFYYI